MRFEIPECRRCFFCVPLRYGICLFGYINLLFTILVLSMELWLGWNMSATTPSLHLYRGVAMYTQIWFCVVLCSFEILFNLILLVGAHTRRKALLRTYYYYGMATTCATFVAVLLMKIYDYAHAWPFHVIDIALDTSGFVIHVYLLCLVRSELSKPRYRSGGVAFVNQAAELISPPPWGDGRNPL